MKLKTNQTSLKAEQWYRQLIVDLKMILVKTASDIIRRKHEFGTRILRDEEYLNKQFGEKGLWMRKLSHDVKLSEREIYRCLACAKKFSKEALEENLTSMSNLTWMRFIEVLLPEWRKDKFSISMPENNTYNVIYADPPWHYEMQTSRKTPYPDMPLEEICNLKIPISNDAILFLWTTKEHLKDALKVIETWGFEYKSQFAWVKDKIGMGSWVRGQHELLLIAIKGNFPPPPPENRVSSVIQFPRQEHSQKPILIYDIIEKMYPNQKYLELFARNKRENWFGWGLEYENNNKKRI